MTKMLHYRKNNDPNFLNGEDLKFGLIKDMPDGVVVEIASVKEDVGYDQQAKAKVPVVVLMFKDLKGNLLPKGVIPAKWTHTFMKTQGVRSPYINDWVGQKLIIFAEASKVHGYVVRFKEYKDPNFKPKLTHKSKSWDNIIAWLKDPKHTMEMLLTKYDVSKDDQKKLEEACKIGKDK